MRCSWPLMLRGDSSSSRREGLIRALEFPARMDSALSTRLFATFAAEGGAHAAKLAKQHHRVRAHDTVL